MCRSKHIRNYAYASFNLFLFSKNLVYFFAFENVRIFSDSINFSFISLYEKRRGEMDYFLI